MGAPHIQQQLKAIERALGRKPGQAKFASRTIDIDLLTYGDQILSEPALPRDEILTQSFVLKPLAELAGDRRHPVLHQSYGELWQAFAGTDDLEPIPLDWRPGACRT